eukprot:2092874-Prymnesium_polylepis.1
MVGLVVAAGRGARVRVRVGAVGAQLPDRRRLAGLPPPLRRGPRAGRRPRRQGVDFAPAERLLCRPLRLLHHAHRRALCRVLRARGPRGGTRRAAARAAARGVPRAHVGAPRARREPL